MIITTILQLSLHNSNRVPFVLLPTSKPCNFSDVRGIVLVCSSRCGGDGVCAVVVVVVMVSVCYSLGGGDVVSV